MYRLGIRRPPGARGSERRAQRPLRGLRRVVLGLVLVSVLVVTDVSPLAASTGDSAASGASGVSVADGVELSWSEPSVQAGDVTSYRILRRRPGLGEYSLLVLVADTGSRETRYLDADVVSGTRYIYRVVALRGTAAAPRSNKVKVTFEAPAVVPETSEGSGQLRTETDEQVAPSEPVWSQRQLIPTGLVATAEQGFVVLSWNAPVGDADSVDGYEILRRRSNRGENALATLVADTGTVDTTYVDRTANEADVKYAYRVKALRGGTASNWSGFATAIGQANTVSYVGGTEPDLDDLETGEQRLADEEATKVSNVQFYIGYTIHNIWGNHLGFKNPIQMANFAGGYRLERLHREQYEDPDGIVWPADPNKYHIVEDSGVTGGWEYHNIGIPACGTKYFRVAALYHGQFYSVGAGSGWNYDFEYLDDPAHPGGFTAGTEEIDNGARVPSRRGSWSYIEWRNADCEDDSEGAN